MMGSTTPASGDDPAGNPGSGDVLVTSRSFAEYVAFFDLEEARLPARVLDCCAGASSFVAEATSRGIDAVAVDPAYGASVDQLLDTAAIGSDGATDLISANEDRFTYDWYGSPQRRAQMRRRALGLFIRHYTADPDRYVRAGLPELPFADSAFDLALVSHLLFTWASTFDEAWHLEALTELCRVAREVRVFPLVLLGSGADVDFLPSVVARLRERGLCVDIEPVPYEFQVGARQMLRLRRRTMADGEH